MLLLKETKTNRAETGARRAPFASLLNRERLARFANEEDGMVTLFALYMIMMMLLVGGIGVDLMRNEMERTKLQNTLDRAVLAAADLDQPLDPQAVVQDYFDKAGMSGYLSSVTVNEGLNFRTVTANASMSTPTQFMRLMGVDNLTAPALGEAEERVTNVEISMVLDISGSMGWNNKMFHLQNAAKTFVDTVIRDETTDLVSISLIPYTAQVNAGADIFNELNTNHMHDFSYCVDFIPEDFTTPAISFTRVYDQMQHFDAGWSYSNPIANPGCPQQSFEEIVPFSQNRADLKNTIDDYRARANTAIHIGMKWGVAMLDPSFRPITQQLSLNGRVENIFGGRPVAYDDQETLKTVVLMTDGQNVNTMRIRDWYYDSPSERAHWSKYPLHWYLNRYVSSNWNNWRYTKYTSGDADGMLHAICNQAKQQGIIVWTIGFEVTSHSANIMEQCASSPSHYFQVTGTEITEAFEAIAKQINQLRLTQ